MAETYHFHWMFYDVMAQPEMREMFQRRIDYDRWTSGKFKWPIPIREFWIILPFEVLKYLLSTIIGPRTAELWAA